MRNIGIISLGCPKNLVDSEIIIGLLIKKGFILVSETKLDKADILIVNTCSFIQPAKEESVDTILKLAKYKKNGRCKLLIVAGCMVQQYKDKLIGQLPEVDFFVGTGDIFKIVKIIEGRARKKIYADMPGCLYDAKTPRYISTPFYMAYIKIAEGCNNQCSYCLIPSLRGKYKSRPMASILEEARKLSEKGVKEINLIAQDTTFYGMDLYGKFKLSVLLKELAKIKEIKWIRLLYTYPSHINAELVKTIARYKKICKYIDLPLQHINDRILFLMNRHYNKNDILDLINYLRLEIPNISLRTVFINGFPRETEEEFNELLDFIKKIKFENVGSFIYSREKGTKAFFLKPQIFEKIKKERQRKLMNIQQKILCEKNKKELGKIKEVVIESQCDKKNYLKTRLKEDAFGIDRSVYVYSKAAKKIGDFIQIKITGTGIYDLEGVCVEKNMVNY
ncbi:30S ribosomal protein S12 methylthiotransferase RimO [bacterium]|nr:30S ribosomal protein S12 methylthiotransferase RimO [bacterium]